MDLKHSLIWENWIDHLENRPDSEAIIHISFDEEPYIWTFKSLFESAINFAAFFKKQGLKRGEVCVIIMRHNKYFYPIYIGASLVGAVTTVLAYKNPKLH